MDARKQRILEAIVALYALDGEPVGSGLLANYFDMAVSSATLRNEMAALTKLGLLEQPHTSAGRVPSPKGYRYYLDHLLETPESDDLSDEDREKIDRLFAQMDAEPEKLAQSAARALADYTGCAAAASTPQALDLCIAHFEVVQVGLYSAAVLAVTNAGGVRTRVARVDAGFSRSDAVALAQLLNRGLTFVSPDDVTPELTVSLLMAAGQRLAPVVSAAEALVCAQPQAYLEGAHYLAQRVDTRENLGMLLKIFSDNAAANALITPGDGGTTAKLGEDMMPEMPGLCIVCKRYLAGGGLTGTVALVGSSRMKFQRMIPILDYFSLHLGQQMSGNKQEEQI
jgi:heat-inducible transcriptional repressor